MRPIRLEVEGFTCYRERQQPLDFSSLSLFAIAGPTGAGKSSILDTMLYALYGEVPRIGKQGIVEFISHGRDVMSVCLDFRVSGRDYRVTRLSKRGRQGALKTEATLAELVGGVEKSLADAVKPVNEAVVALLGLRYDEFIQTVVLPQGDFAKFLKARPTEQREILQHLLRHDVYIRMREAAEERRKALDGRIQVLDGKIATYVDATPAALAEREASLLEARARVDDAKAATAAADLALQEAQQRHALTQEVAKLRGQQQALEQQAPAVERAREELAQARRAMPIVPRLEAADAAATRADAARGAREQTAKTMDQAATRRARAAAQWEAATAAATECTSLISRVQALDGIAAEIARRAELTTAMADLRERIASAEANAKAAAKSESAARHTAGQARAAVDTSRAAHDAVAFDEPLYARIETAFAQVGDARAQQRDLAGLTAEVEGATRARAIAEHDEHIARAAHDAASQQAQMVAREAAAARRDLEGGRIRHRAAALREHLHAGDDCPVCLQAVIEVPKVTAPPELAGLERADRAAADRAAEGETARQTAFTALATASARLDAAVAAVNSASARAQTRAATFDALLATLSAAVPGAPAAESGTLVLDWYEQRRADLLAARSARARHAEALRQAESAAAAAEVALAHAAGDAKAALVLHGQLVADHARLENDLAAVVERIRAVTTSDDPQAERKANVARAAELRDAEHAAKEALTAADLEATTAHERLRAAEASVREADADVASANASLAQALAVAGFSRASAVKTALRTPAQQTALEAQVAAFDNQRAGIIARLAELEPQVAGREVSADALVEVDARRRAAMDAWQASSQRVATLENEVARLQKAIAALAVLAVERHAVRIELGVTAEMAADLKGDRFQNYLLEEAFKALVTGASIRMRDISNRYTLEWEDSEFHVVDHDNAGERRRADTLSGGEMFMASLCLALQLSEEVLKTSGALQMDSLFIDEGFGSLDLDSLSEVTDAIEALGHDGGRLIGVISHRAELTDRMPGCIRIDKGAGESRWVMERAG